MPGAKKSTMLMIMNIATILQTTFITFLDRLLNKKLIGTSKNIEIIGKKQSSCG